MIRTTTQLKAKVRNLSGGDSTKAQTLIRVFIMERFLVRKSYKVDKYTTNDCSLIEESSGDVWKCIHASPDFLRFDERCTDGA